MKQQINLMPTPAGLTVGVTAATVVLTSCVFAALCLVFYVLKQTHVDGLRAELDAAQVREEAALRRSGAIGAALAETDDGALAALLETASAALADSERMLAFLDTSAPGARPGFSARLRALARQSRDGLWLTRITISAADGRVVLTGRAGRPDMVPDYLAALAGEPAFDGQTFQHVVLERPDVDAGRVEFSIRSERPERFASGGD